MRIPKPIDNLYLSELSEKIRVLPPDEAASFLFEASALILLSGYLDIAYQLLTNLLAGELKISEESVLAHPIKSILPSLCYSIGISCPAIFSEKEILVNELEQHILEKYYQYEQVANMDKFFNLALPSGNWSEDFLYEITHPKVDILGNERFKIYQFLQDLYRIVSVHLAQKRLQYANRLLRIFTDVVNAWQLEYKGWIEQEILIFGIRTYLEIDDISNADKYILKWWQSSDSLIGALSLVSYLPSLMKRISEGVLQDEIKISQTQTQEIFKSISNRNYNCKQIGFIPTVEDWNIFLKKWNQKIFDNIDEEHLQNYEVQYSQVLEYKQCFKEGATEEQIINLEEKLQTKLPLSYKNFLLATNGFVIWNEYCELFGTEQINWFIEENRNWAECWDGNDDVSDEKYFQYGEHQDCIWIRGRYMKTALQISSSEDGYVYLLNPLIVDDRNEWESWDFGSKLPGADRYRSFWDMMQSIYKRTFG